MALFMIVPVYADVQKSVDKALLKAQQKQAKKKLKEYEKDGWKIVGSNTMEVALLRHYSKQIELGDDFVEFHGVSTATKSKNVGEQMALNNAITKYANKAMSTVKGRVANDMYADGATEGEGEFEKFYAAYERLIETRVKNVLIPSYTIMRKNENGLYEVEAYYIVDESKAHNARQAALENAIKESELAGKYADKVREYVGDKVSED